MRKTTKQELRQIRKDLEETPKYEQAPILDRLDRLITQGYDEGRDAEREWDAHRTELERNGRKEIGEEIERVRRQVVEVGNKELEKHIAALEAEKEKEMEAVRQRTEEWGRWFLNRATILGNDANVTIRAMIFGKVDKAESGKILLSGFWDCVSKQEQQTTIGEHTIYVCREDRGQEHIFYVAVFGPNEYGRFRSINNVCEFSRFLKRIARKK